MLNSVAKIIHRQAVFLTVAAGVLLVALKIFPGTLLIDDPFHYGEYFAAAMNFPVVDGVGHSLVIHGALDYIPALLTEKLWGEGRYFIPTLAVYKILNFISAMILTAIAYRLTVKKHGQWLLIVAVLLVAPLLVGYRDLFLLVSIYLFMANLRCDSNLLSAVILKILLGAFVAFGIFWSYDRGLAGALSLGAAVLVLLSRNRMYVISMVSFVASVAILVICFEAFSLSNYLNDLLVLTETSGQWSYGWQKMPVILSVLTILINGFAFSLLIEDCIRSNTLYQRAPMVVAMGLLAACMVKIGINRADVQHIYWSLWVPMLIALNFYGGALQSRRLHQILMVALFIVSVAGANYVGGYGLGLVVGLLIYSALYNVSQDNYIVVRVIFIVCVLAVLVAGLSKGLRGIAAGKYSWMASLLAPPDNRSASTHGVIWATDRLLERNVHCVFDLSNNGVINGLARRPSCTKFTYPVYGGPKHEPELIDQLRAASPEALVYSAEYWSYAIDGKSMRQRFPVLDKFILLNYPMELCSQGYCVRYSGN